MVHVTLCHLSLNHKNITSNDIGTAMFIIELRTEIAQLCVYICNKILYSHNRKMKLGTSGKLELNMK